MNARRHLALKAMAIRDGSGAGFSPARGACTDGQLDVSGERRSNARIPIKDGS